jgi:transcriptional regulator with XRE-family HTH domain
MREIGDRLRAERKRLGLGQAELGQLGDVKIQAQGLYESGERYPRADYLALIAQAGVDVQYVITGVASASTYSERNAHSHDEQRLLLAFRKLDEAGRASFLMVISMAARGAANEAG